MKKSLIALAVAGAVSAPAFAATSNVDVYGIMNVSVNRVDSGTTGKDKSFSVSSHASRLGFKGSEDLGGGLSAIWQIESSINAEEGSGNLGGRNTFVGLKGGFGTVLLGQHDTPMKLLGRKVDNFGDLYADSRNLLGADAASGKSNFDLRTKNTIAYMSPSFSGFSVAAAYVADHQGGLATPTACASGLDCNKNDAYSITAGYDNGPLMLGLGYEKQNISTGATTTNSRKLFRVVGGYSFGDFKLGALYENGSADSALATADRNAWGLFGNYAIGAVTLKANFLKVGDYKNSNNTSAKQYTVGADYSLSKRTTAYAYYAKLKNDTNAAFDLGVGGGVTDTTLTVAGNDPSVFGLGMKHSF
jgi:predicted porin